MTNDLAPDLTRVEVIGYCRVSTERQAGEVFTSLDDQKTAITTRARKLSREVGVWFVDAGASGGTMERPEFQRMFVACEAAPRSASRPGMLLVLNSSRWARLDDPEEAAFWRVRFRQLGWIVTYAEHDEIANPTVRHVMRAVGDAQASEYRAQIKANAVRGARGAANQGFWRGIAPFGYRRAVVFPPGRERVLNNGTPKAPDEKVKLAPQADEAAIVKMMFESYMSGEHSFETLTRHLIRTVPSFHWDRARVGSILKNPAYVGDVVGGRRRGGGRQGNCRLRPPEDWYGMADAHPAIVDRATFDAVQARARTNGQLRGAVRSDYTVTGLVTCATCGRPMIGGGLGGRRRKTGDKSRPSYYKCSSGLMQRELCPGRLACVAKHLLEPAVVTTVGKVLSRQSVRKAITSAIDDAIAEGHREPSQVPSAVRALTTAVQKRDRLVAAVAGGTFTPAEASAQLEALRRDIALLERSADQARFQARSAASLRAERDALIQSALDFSKVAKSLDGPALRELLRPWIANATFDKHTRYLSLSIRRVPSLLLEASPETGNQQQVQGGTITARVRVGAGGRDKAGRFA